MKTSNENRWAFKVLAGNYISEEDLEGLGISADWHLYLSPTEPPSASQCNQQMNAYDLSTCPCCGGRATIIGTLKTCEWSVICTMCGLETAHMMQPRDAASAWNKRHAPDEEGSTPPESGGQGDMDYTPGVLDSTAPPRIWLQVDTSASNDERDEAFPADLDGVTWQDESIGGLEVQYVRADLAQGGGNER